MRIPLQGDCGGILSHMRLLIGWYTDSDSFFSQCGDITDFKACMTYQTSFPYCSLPYPGYVVLQ